MVTLIIFAVSLISCFVPWYPLQMVGSMLLLGFWPGYALLRAIAPPLNEVERWLIAVPVSYGLTIAGLMGLAFAGIPIMFASVTVLLAGWTVLLGGVAWRRSQSSQPSAGGLGWQTVPLVWLAVMLGTAATFRMLHVHYSDYQGDEAGILFPAVAVLYGQLDAILTHTKGPGEILLLSGIGTLTGQFDELTTRLLYAFAGTVAVGLTMWLGTRLFDLRVGVIAGLLMAVEGVYISYARTAQYQSAVIMMITAAVLCYVVYHQTNGKSRGLHALGSFLLAMATLTHWEVALLMPLAAYLTVAHLDWSAFKPREILRAALNVWLSPLVYGGLVLTFYIPFLLHPEVSDTGVYLESRIGSGAIPPFNNFYHFFYEKALKYNPAYQVILVNGLLVLAAIGALTTALNRSYRWSLAAIGLPVLLGASLYLLGLDRLSAGVVGLASGAFFAVVILAPRTPLADRVLYLWFAPALWIFLTLVARPGKHHYLFLSILLMLAGVTLIRLWDAARNHWPILNLRLSQGLAAGVGLALGVIFAAHAVMLFLRSDNEFILSYPEHKSAFFPTDNLFPYDTRIGFGFPYRLGWQTIGALKQDGLLDGTWVANDDGNTLEWYMHGERQTRCYPDYVIRAEITFKYDSAPPIPFVPEDFGYVPRYRIWKQDEVRMTVLAFDPAATANFVDLQYPYWFDDAISAKDFAPSMTASEAQAPPQIALDPAPVLGEGSEIKLNAPDAYIERAQHLHGRVAILGYDVETSYAYPGGIVPLNLHWHTLETLSLRYKVFIHLQNADGHTVAQADDFPVCGLLHANTWGPGMTVIDRHLLRLPADMPPGEYALVVGMYEPDLNLRLNYFDIAHNEQGNSVTIGTLSVPETEP